MLIHAEVDIGFLFVSVYIVPNIHLKVVREYHAILYFTFINIFINEAYFQFNVFHNIDFDFIFYIFCYIKEFLEDECYCRYCKRKCEQINKGFWCGIMC